MLLLLTSLKHRLRACDFRPTLFLCPILSTCGSFSNVLISFIQYHLYVDFVLHIDSFFWFFFSSSRIVLNLICGSVVCLLKDDKARSAAAENYFFLGKFRLLKSKVARHNFEPSLRIKILTPTHTSTMTTSNILAKIAWMRLKICRYATSRHYYRLALFLY